MVMDLTTILLLITGEGYSVCQENIVKTDINGVSSGVYTACIEKALSPRIDIEYVFTNMTLTDAQVKENAMVLFVKEMFKQSFRSPVMWPVNKFYRLN